MKFAHIHVPQKMNRTDEVKISTTIAWINNKHLCPFQDELEKYRQKYGCFTNIA